MKAKRHGAARRPAGAANPESARSPASSPAREAARAGGSRGKRRCRAWLCNVALLLASCTPSLQPCRSPNVCPKTEECLAQRCLPLGAEPVDPGSRRLVLEPVQVAVVRAHHSPQPGVPPTVSLGGPSGQSEQLLVRFPEAQAGLDVSAAFLLLEPAVGAEPSAGDVVLDVALASGSWSSGTADEAPSTRSPSSSGVGRTRPPSALRIDVTAQVRELVKQPGQNRGFVIRASGTSARGAVYSTGADGFAPRLDVYFRSGSGAP
jgi:hypothetical protein